jgi:hypothetical protein
VIAAALARIDAVLAVLGLELAPWGHVRARVAYRDATYRFAGLLAGGERATTRP